MSENCRAVQPAEAGEAFAMTMSRRRGASDKKSEGEKPIISIVSLMTSCPCEILAGNLLMLKKLLVELLQDQENKYLDPQLYLLFFSD